MKTLNGSTRLRTRPAAAVVLVALLALAACGGDKSVTPSGPIEQMVALGDSYASGPGLPPVANGPCVRSGKNYGALIAAKLRVADYADMTCGGAKTSDLVKAQDSKGVTINPPQLSAITKKTDLVTLGIGLNDDGLSAKVLYLCLPQFDFAAQCAAYLAQPGADIIKEIDAITDKIKVAIDAIRDLAPRSRIVLIGYPNALPENGSCPAALPLSDEAVERLKFTAEATELAYRAVAKKTKVLYVSTYQMSAGHDMCSKHPWVNGIADAAASGQGAALHPRPAFMRAVADRVVELVSK